MKEFQADQIEIIEYLTMHMLFLGLKVFLGLPRRSCVHVAQTMYAQNAKLLSETSTEMLLCTKYN